MNKQDRERARELIHEYKLLKTQAKVYLSNNNLDKFINCLDEMRAVEDAYRKIQRAWKKEKLFIIVSLS